MAKPVCPLARDFPKIESAQERFAFFRHGARERKVLAHRMGEPEPMVLRHPSDMCWGFDGSRVGFDETNQQIEQCCFPSAGKSEDDGVSRIKTQT